MGILGPPAIDGPGRIKRVNILQTTPPSIRQHRYSGVPLAVAPVRDGRGFLLYGSDPPICLGLGL